MSNSNRLFDVYIAVDWSAKSVPSSVRPSKDALWVGEKYCGGKQKETYWRTRFECLEYIKSLLSLSIKSNQRVLVGYDLDFGFPAGFVSSLGLNTTDKPWKSIWHKLNELIVDNPDNSNNRFEVASYLNSLCMNSDAEINGPLWGHPVNRSYSNLSPKSPSYPYRVKDGVELRKFRWTEMRESRAQPVWKLIGSASVGGQTLVGIPAIYKLRFDPLLEKYSQIWPFETGFNPTFSSKGHPMVTHIEIWPGILNQRLDQNIAIRDQAQVRATVDWMSECDNTGEMVDLLGVPRDLSKDQQIDCLEEEGWVLGMGTIVSD
jgi:hypothetical protein